MLGTDALYLVELLLWDLLSDWSVVLVQVQYKAQKTTLCLVANLLRQTPFRIRWLERERRTCREYYYIVRQGLKRPFGEDIENSITFHTTYNTTHC